MTNTGDHYDYDLGTFSRAVSTRSAEAQRWFDRGLVWCYAFGHEEAGRCFRRAADPPSSAEQERQPSETARIPEAAGWIGAGRYGTARTAEAGKPP